VAGEPEILSGRKVIQKARWKHGRLHVSLSPEARALMGKGVFGTSMFRELCKTPLEEENPEGLDPLEIRGDRITPDFNAPIEDKAVIIMGCGITRDNWEEYLEMSPDAELWTMNDERHDRATRHFQIHTKKHYAQMGKEFFGMDDLYIPIYTPENFPIDGIRRVFLNTTVDFMLAIADMDGFSTVYLPGVDFGGKKEAQEKDSARYWLGILEGKGCRVFYSAFFTGFDCSVYGRCDP
jgi:hypothetical protein